MQLKSQRLDRSTRSTHPPRASGKTRNMSQTQPPMPNTTADRLKPVEPSHHLVLGAAGGIGQALCSDLVARGDRVMLAGRTESSLSAIASELGQPYRVVDARDWEAVDGLVAETLDEFGSIDGAVNLAGSILLKPAHLTSRDDVQEVLEQNVFTAFALVRSVAPKMKRSGGGSIVVMSSGGAAIGVGNHEAIALAKGGVAAMARAAAATYAGSNVRINSVAPGLVKTRLTERVWQNERAATASLSMHPLGRLGESTDIASILAFLLSPNNSWITGQDIAVDGGLSSVKSMR